MGIYKYKSNFFSFEMLIPDGWASSPAIDSIDHAHSPEEKSDSRTIVGPYGKYLNIIITPLSVNEPEPAIIQTEQFFDGLAQRQELHVIATGTINVADKPHFWATYHRGFLLTLAIGGQMQFFKKYCLYLNRVECLITAGLFFVRAGERMPTDQDLGESEKLFDVIVKSIRLVNTEEN
jgi:hypothetical protein